MPQSSVLGLLFFNIFINNLLLFIKATTLCNYADDNTMFSSAINSKIVISRPRHDFAIISELLYENSFCLFSKPFLDFSFENIIIKNVTEEKILGVLIENNFNFKSHVNNIYNKANQKRNPFTRILKLANPIQRKKLTNSFINSFIVLWCGCFLQRDAIKEFIKVNSFNDYESSFDSLLSTCNE